jgi:hypothetical protein
VTEIERWAALALALAILVLGPGFLAYHRGRHVQSNIDRRLTERAQRRFSMAQVLEYGKVATYRIHAFGQSGREMPVPPNPAAVATPPEVVTLTLSPDGQLLHVANRNQTDSEINVVVALNAGGLATSASFVFRPESVADLTLELVEEQTG